MGMTIDESLLYMELYKRKLFNSVSDLDKDIEAYDIAIETMRKYQKIEQIINYPVYIQEDVLRYKMICEVVGKKNITHGTYEGENRGGN